MTAPHTLRHIEREHARYERMGEQRTAMYEVLRDFARWMSADWVASHKTPHHKRDEQGLQSFVDAARAILARIDGGKP